MYTGTLIKDLIAAVEQVQAQAGDPEMRRVRAKNQVEDHGTEAIPAGSLNAGLDFADSAGHIASASDLGSPRGTLDDTVCNATDEDFPLADAHMWAVPSGAADGFGHHDPLA